MKFWKLVSISVVFVLSTSTNAASIYLDGDTVATGSTLGSAPLATSFGNITFTGEFRETADDDFIAAGSTGNVFDIDYSATAEFSFDFDVESISFIYGGNIGVFDIVAKDIFGNVLDSFYGTTNDGDSAGPITLSGSGIRSLFWQDPGYGFAAIDNITISTSAVPVPTAVWLFGSGLIGLVRFTKRKKA